MKRLGICIVFTLFHFFYGMAQEVPVPPTENPIEKHPQQQKIKVFPNPATTVVNLLGLKNSARADISVSDLYGKVLLNYKREIRNQALSIPLHRLNPGLYVVHIRSKEQRTAVKFYKK